MQKQEIIAKTAKKIGVDTGGTFTDIVMYTDDTLLTHKVLSTPQNPAHAVIQGVGRNSANAQCRR